ncbi:hypothetical protein quinque_001458 [Culex quinquefasciatus]
MAIEARHEENNNKEIEVSFGISGHCVEHLATSSTETTLNTGCQLVNPSTFGPGTAADALKADFKNSVPATIGTLEFQSTKAAAPVLAGLEWILDPGGDYENLSQPPGAIVSLGTSQQLTQSTLAGPQCTFGCLDDVKGLCRKWGDIVTTGIVNVPTVHSSLDSNSASMPSLDCR